jgi:hypothetical protein
MRGVPGRPIPEKGPGGEKNENDDCPAKKIVGKGSAGIRPENDVMEKLEEGSHRV